jgi:hypothetical protein
MLTLVLWGLAGALFGSLFAGLYRGLAALGLHGWQPLVFAAVGAAGTTSAFYSAMPVALVGAMAGVLASIGYLMTGAFRVQLGLITMIAGTAGIVAGGFYAWMAPGGGRSLAQTSTGLIAGLIAGSLLWIGLNLYGEAVAMVVMAAGVVALVGTIFQLAQKRVVAAMSGRVPRALSAALVAGLIAAVVGAAVWTVVGSAAWSPDLATKSAIEQIVTEVPSGFLGGMAGGAITGALLEMVGIHLEEDEHLV